MDQVINGTCDTTWQVGYLAHTSGRQMNERTAMSITGSWKVTISTPIGKQFVVLEISERDGTITGIAKGDAESVPMLNPVLVGNRLTWTQSITRPMRLHLTFDVTFDGDTLSGTSKAGMLPSSKVTGTRVAA